MEQSIVRKKLLEYLEETKMSKYKFAQRSGISLSTIYDIIRKEDYDIRESNIMLFCTLNEASFFRLNEAVVA